MVEQTLQHTNRFFSDDKMFFLTLAFAIYMAAIGVQLLRWHDWDVVWVGAVESVWIFFWLYYYFQWLDADSTEFYFPQVEQLFRPAFVAVMFLIATYSTVRLWHKHRIRHDA